VSLAVDHNRAGDGTATVRLRGEADMSVENCLRAALYEAVAATPPPSAVIIDLRDLTFLDCAAVRVLLETSRLAQAAAVPLTVCDPQPLVRRVLGALGLAELLGLATVPMSRAAVDG
jgi:anti-anti-sigma factor